MILVIEWGRTGIDVVRHALDTAPDLHQAIIGAALNKTKMDRLRKYDVQHKSMYKDKYYAKYAYLESSQGVCGEVDQNAACRFPIEIADGSLGSRRYGGSNFAELELSNRNQDSGTSRDKILTACPLKNVIMELTTSGSEIIASGCEAACWRG